MFFADSFAYSDIAIFFIGDDGVYLAFAQPEIGKAALMLLMGRD